MVLYSAFHSHRGVRHWSFIHISNTIHDHCTRLNDFISTCWMDTAGAAVWRQLRSWIKVSWARHPLCTGCNQCNHKQIDLSKRLKISLYLQLVTDVVMRSSTGQYVLFGPLILKSSETFKYSVCIYFNRINQCRRFLFNCDLFSVRNDDRRGSTFASAGSVVLCTENHILD